MTDARTRRGERRRSQRIPLSVPVNIASLDPMLLFSGRCNTLDVSFHGCQFYISRPLKHGVRLRLELPDTQRTAVARVVRLMPAVHDMRVMLWKVGMELDQPGNIWGVEPLPADWAF